MGKKVSSLPYTERDVSWMYFNRRILQEACRPEVPLLERLVFIQYVPQDDMAELPVLCDLQKRLQNDFPLICRFSHSAFFLL